MLRKDAGMTQAQLTALAGTNQATINRYETDRVVAPYRILVWYATYFNISLDYIFGLCEDLRGWYVCVTQEGVQRKPEWSEFARPASRGRRAEPPAEADDPQYGRRGKAQVRRRTP